MRKIFIMGLFALLIMQACKKNDQELIDGKRPEERVAADLEKYRNELVSSPNGWVAYLNTTIVGGSYNFYISFDKDNKVIMRADYNEDAALESIQSTYRIKQIMAPSIIFDTYTLLHYLQDPDDESFNGDYAVGYGSDFEFEIREQVGDTIKLIGKKRKAPLILIKATAEEKAFYTSNQFSDNIAGITQYLKDNPFTYFLDPKDGNRKIQVSISPDVRSRAFSFISLMGTSVVNNTGIFSFSDQGIRLPSPIKEAGLIFTDVKWDSGAKKLFLVTTAGDKIELIVSPVPVLPLSAVLGSAYTSVNLPNATTFPGWGTDFITRRAQVVTRIRTAGINVGGVAVTLGEMSFSLNSTSKIMVVGITTPFGVNSLNIAYPYSYTKSDNGIFKFTIIPDFDGNSAFFYNNVNKPLGPILDERINVDSFKLDYFVHPTTGAVLGQFISIEHPDFMFTGTLQ